jgi:ferredoxin
MKIDVDMNKCQNHGQCAIAAPSVFRMNASSELEYDTTADDSLLGEVEDAADVCPVQAIIIGA